MENRKIRKSMKTVNIVKTIQTLKSELRTGSGIKMRHPFISLHTRNLLHFHFISLSLSLSLVLKKLLMNLFNRWKRWAAKYLLEGLLVLQGQKGLRNCHFQLVRSFFDGESENHGLKRLWKPFQYLMLILILRFTE